MSMEIEMIDDNVTEDEIEIDLVYARQLFFDILNTIQGDAPKLRYQSNARPTTTAVTAFYAPFSEEGALYSLWISLTRYLAVQDWDAETLIEDVHAHVEDEIKSGEMARLLQQWRQLVALANQQSVLS